MKSSEIKEKMGEAEETEKEIEARSNEYRPVAKRASLLYFCLADLAVVRERERAFDELRKNFSQSLMPR